ncbi:MAG: DNA polymerase III subunit delta [Acidobacteria bacterium]|nr:DNA polymerase III subunit delta [Acidobacteriota bacterium]
MTPDRFLAQIRKQPPAPVWLFLGPENHRREMCRKALVECVLAPEEREHGLVRHDLDGLSLAEVVDDARSMSLFAPHRLIWVSGAEAALPRGRAASSEDTGPGASLLADYAAAPAPGVVLVFDTSRYDFEGEDKAKQDRVRKFYAAIPHQVEFVRFTEAEATQLAGQLAREAGLKMGDEETELLVESLGADAARIAAEIEKLRLYVGPGGEVRREQIAELVPDSRSTTVFALVAALGRNDRVRALELLDTLVREGEYLPLALAFLATQFRLALVAKEAGIKSAPQILAHFSKLGVPMWRSRAEQVQQTVAAFTGVQLSRALGNIFAADRALRDARPDDRIVLEDFVLRLTDVPV